jgi:hypothetical protein
VAEQVTSALLAQVGPAVASLGLDQYLGKSLDQAKKQLGEGLTEGAAVQPQERLKGLLGK